jgi:hypothetical protein
MEARSIAKYFVQGERCGRRRFSIMVRHLMWQKRSGTDLARADPSLPSGAHEKADASIPNNFTE